MEKRLVYINTCAPGPYCTLTQVIDAITGEILLEQRQDDVEHALNSGTNIAYTQAMVKRETTTDGNICLSVSTPDGFILSHWNSGKKKSRRGGRKSYVKLYPACLELAPPQQNCLIRLSPYLAVNGKLMDQKARRPLSAAKIFTIWECSRSQGYRLLQTLNKKGIITKCDGAFYLNRKYLARG